MKKIQERYKEDKKRQQEEMMKLYQEHEINPLGSCLPLVLQLPFFFALYQTLRKGGQIFDLIRSKPASDDGFLFIPNLTKSVTHHTGVLIVLLILYVGTQLASSWVSAINVQDKTQRRLLFVFPIVFSFIIIRFPAGLIVYWITTNVWTVGQQLFIRRFLPPPEPAAAGGTAAAGGARAGASGRGTASGRTDGAEQPASGGGFLARVRAAAQGPNAGDGGADRTAAGSRASSPGRGSGRGRDAASGRGRSGSGDGKGSARTEGKGSSRRESKGSAPAGGGDGNGGPGKAPPPSPRKKKKRSGRRR
jgi:YidC/Oxa1 family membrane protein insertase